MHCRDAHVPAVISDALMHGGALSRLEFPYTLSSGLMTSMIMATPLLRYVPVTLPSPRFWVEEEWA